MEPTYSFYRLDAITAPMQKKDHAHTISHFILFVLLTSLIFFSHLLNNYYRCIEKTTQETPNI